MGFLFHAGPQPYPRHHHPRRDAAALSPVARAQARQLARAIRPLGLRGLRALHRMVSGRHRPHRGGDGDLRRHGPAMSNAYLPREAEIVERIEESPSLFTLRLRLTDPALQAAYRYAPGQFNMLYLHGAGEIAISIVSDPDDPRLIDHTIRAVGRVTRGMQKLKQGDRLGLRGPYGRGWPMQEAEGRDVVVVTGGLGCAPVAPVITYIARRRERYGRRNIVQGVKHSSDFIWRERYAAWRALPDTQVLLAADAGEPLWPWHIGRVTDLFDQLRYDPQHVSVMMCGPEGMMHVVARHMQAAGVAQRDIWLSMERNMQCALGHCGHCQYGAQFICRDGPVFSFDRVAALFVEQGLAEIQQATQHQTQEQHQRRLPACVLESRRAPARARRTGRYHPFSRGGLRRAGGAGRHRLHRGQRLHARRHRAPPDDSRAEPIRDHHRRLRHGVRRAGAAYY